MCTLFAAVCVCAAVTGCKQNVGTSEDNAVVEEEDEETAEEETEEGYLFGYSCIDLDNPYYETLGKSIETELTEAGDRMVTKDAGSDPDVQLEQIQELIDAGVDAVFLCPVDWEEITPGLEALEEAGIPVINVDTQVKEADLVDAYVGSDNKNAGYVCGEDLIEQYPDGGKIVIMECQTVNSVIERITGFEEAIASAGFEVLSRSDAGVDKETAQAAMKTLLEQYPQIDAVMCGNDQVALGVLAAVQEAGRTEVKIYGVDGSPEVKAEIASGNSLIAGTGAQSPINIGKTAAEVGTAILNGDEYESETYVETFFINEENVELYGTDGWQ